MLVAQDMEIQKLIKALVANLPAEHNDEENFYTFIKRSFDEYITLLFSLDSVDVENLLADIDDFKGAKTRQRFVNLVKTINQKCLEILQLAYKGDLYTATSLLFKLLNYSKYTKGYLVEPYRNYFGFVIDNERTYYRCVSFAKGEIPSNCNHLPYYLRYKSHTSRFNQIGYPCLYLASSLDLAIQEIIKEEYEDKDFYVSEFIPQKPLLLLNFVLPSENEILEMNKYDMFRFLITYPIYILNLTKTQHHNCEFKEEYLFSQLFFHIWYMNKNYERFSWTGICYTSMCNRNEYNIVIPALYNTKEPPHNNSISDFIQDCIEEKGPYRIDL